MAQAQMEIMCIKQFWQWFAPEDDHVELPHATQVELDEARTVAEKVPATQLVQVEDLDGDQVPAMQFRHTDPDVAPNTEENVPAIQLLHVDAPTEEDHEPRGQYEHRKTDGAETTVEKVPAGQLIQDVDPEADQVPGTQLKHKVDEEAATMEE